MPHRLNDLQRRHFLALALTLSAPQPQASSQAVVDTYSACIDLNALKAGGINVVIQALTAEELLLKIPPAEPQPGEDVWEHVFTGADAVERLLQDLQQQKSFVEQNSSRIQIVTNAQDIELVRSSGRIALVMMLKSGWINEDLANLQKFHGLGVRVIALCHQAAFSWADSSAELNAKPGLNSFGRDVVRECNRIGMLVDLSHASDQTALDALDASDRPVILSHTKCRALSKSIRDADDVLIQRVAEGGGVIGILAVRSRTNDERLRARLERDRRLKRVHRDPFAVAAGQRAEALIPLTTLDIEHIDHAVKLVGTDKVSLASHCTGVDQWAGFREELIRHGYSPVEADGILGGNMIRLLQTNLEIV